MWSPSRTWVGIVGLASGVQTTFSAASIILQTLVSSALNNRRISVLRIKFLISGSCHHAWRESKMRNLSTSTVFGLLKTRPLCFTRDWIWTRRLSPFTGWGSNNSKSSTGDSVSIKSLYRFFNPDIPNSMLRVLGSSIHCISATSASKGNMRGLPQQWMKSTSLIDTSSFSLIILKYL